jgi:hypothetical protein
MAALALALAVFPAAAGAAGFIGSSAVVKGFFPNLNAPPGANLGPVVVADPAVEFPLIYNSFSSDVAQAKITISSLVNGNNLGCGSGPNPFNGFVYTFTGLAQPITSVFLNPASTLIPTSYSFVGNQVFVDYQCKGTITNNIHTVLDVTFEGAVPVRSLTWGRVKQIYR